MTVLILNNCDENDYKRTQMLKITDGKRSETVRNWKDRGRGRIKSKTMLNFSFFQMRDQ